MACLSQAAQCPEKVHGRILGFSISHDSGSVRIYGYYPEIDQQQQKTSYFRWPVAHFDIWQRDNRWACYRFVENLDSIFLPMHIGRVMDLLEGVPSSAVAAAAAAKVDEVDPQISGPGDGDLPADLRTIIEKHLAELKAREEKFRAQMEQQKLREEKRKAEHEARVERLLAQMEQQNLFIAQLQQQTPETRGRETEGKT